MILAIDPGTTESGIVRLASYNPPHPPAILDCRIVNNRELIQELRGGKYHTDYLAIEQVRSYGMAIGATTLDTVEWCGRFIEAWLNYTGATEKEVIQLPRLVIKVHFCRSARATDANIRQALIDRLGAPGTKKEPGPTYGIKSHLWSALAVGLTAYDQVTEEKEK